VPALGHKLPWVSSMPRSRGWTRRPTGRSGSRSRWRRFSQRLEVWRESAPLVLVEGQDPGEIGLLCKWEVVRVLVPVLLGGERSLPPWMTARSSPSRSSRGAVRFDRPGSRQPAAPVAPLAASRAPGARPLHLSGLCRDAKRRAAGHLSIGAPPFFPSQVSGSLPSFYQFQKHP
jgi:hypothetical protein